MKILTWNVNGIRKRQGELQDLLAAEQPDVMCLQEIKAAPDQIPGLLLSPEGYWCYWHGSGGYSGVALHLKKSSFPNRPEFVHPTFDHESRIVTARSGNFLFASVYVPNGGKDFDAKMNFLIAAPLQTSKSFWVAKRLLCVYWSNSFPQLARTPG